MDRLFGIDISKRPRRRTESDTSSEEETRRQLHPYDALRRSRGRQSSSQNLQPDRQMSDWSHSGRTEPPANDAECHLEMEEATPVARKKSFSGPGVPFEFRGSEPPHSNVPRTVAVPRTTWEFFTKASLGRSSSGVFTNFFQAQEESDYYSSSQQPIGLDVRHKSVLGLPMLDPYSRRHHGWTVLLNCIDATYTAFLIPIIAAFIDRSSDHVVNITTIIEIIFGCVFLLDIFVNFHVGFVIHHDYKKKVVLDGKHAAWYYLKYGGAWIDFLSIIPLFYQVYVAIFFEFGDQPVAIGVLRFFRLLRIYRILKRIYSLSFSGSNVRLIFDIKAPPGVVYVLSIIYSMLVMMNFLGCLLFYVADVEDETLDGTWVFKYIQATREIPEDVSDSREFVLELIQNHTSPELYLTSLYWAVTTVTTVGYGDITPNSFTEMIVLIGVMLSHIMLFGLLVGSISEFVKSALTSAQFQEENKRKIDAIGKWMKYRRLSRTTVRKVNSYYREIKRQTQEFDEEQILEELPLSLRIDVMFKVTKNLLRQLNIFADIQETTLKKIAGRLLPVAVPPGHDLIRQGDAADALYILEEGTLSVLSNEAHVFYIDGPETCAETGILSNFISQLMQHPVTLRTTTSCTLWKLPSKDLAPLFALDGQLQNALLEGYKLRLVQSFELNARSTALIRKVAAEFGCEVDRMLASQLKNNLNAAKVSDGSFRRLLEDIFSGRFAEQSSSRLHRSLVAGNHLTEEMLALEREKRKRSDGDKLCLKELIGRIRQDGEFGMVKLVGLLKTAAGDTGRLDLDGFRRITGVSALLRPHALLLLFTLFDPDETDFIEVFSMIDELRENVEFSSREQHVADHFNKLSASKSSDEIGGILSLAELSRRFRVENHPDVVSGAMSTSSALNQFLKAIGHEDVTSQIFLEFHKDLGMCVETDERFFGLTDSLWTETRK